MIHEKFGGRREFSPEPFFDTYKSCVDRIILRSRSNSDLIWVEEIIKKRLQDRNYTYKEAYRRNWVQKYLIAEEADHIASGYTRVVLIRADITIHQVFHGTPAVGNVKMHPIAFRDYHFQTQCEPLIGPGTLIGPSQTEWCIGDFACLLKPQTLKGLREFIDDYALKTPTIKADNGRFYADVVQMESNFAFWRKFRKIKDLRDEFETNTWSVMTLINRPGHLNERYCDCRYYLFTNDIAKALCRKYLNPEN